MPREKNIALTYQQVAARGANPTAITGMIFDIGIESLHRAARAIDEGKIEDRIKATNKFFAVVAELRSALDYERGGGLAQRLGRFYQFARNQIFAANIRVDRAEFENTQACSARSGKPGDRLKRTTQARRPPPRSPLCAPSRPRPRSPRLTVRVGAPDGSRSARPSVQSHQRDARFFCAASRNPRRTRARSTRRS